MKNGRYRVDIGFKRKRFCIGSFDDYDEAVRMRLNAEHLLHDGFVEAYYKGKEKADADPEWAKKHPVSYNVNLEGLSSKGI